MTSVASKLKTFAVQTDVLTTAKLEGLAEGRAEGRAEGEAKGRAEERALAQKEKLESARSLIESGVPIDVIAKSLGLTSEEIKKLSAQRD
ncbi:MAG: hypothetical protein J5932_11020 [Prevotella sp.]|nr:hypothetical protein [Prevotella sp.]